MTLSAAIKEAYASCPSDVVELPTIEIYHSTWSSPVRLVRDRQNLTATLEAGAPNNPAEEVLFTAFPFNFSLPKIGEGRQELRITIDGASRILIDTIEAMDLTVDDPVRVIYRPYLSTDLSGPHMNPPLKLVCAGERAISINAKQVMLSCGYADFMNRKFPRKIYRIEEFPGLQSRV
jgi:hypothetical protein